MAMDDVISMIKSDHREVERMFSLMLEDATCRPLVLPLAVAVVTAHSRAEEEHVYPVLAADAGEPEGARRSAEEHHRAGRLGRLLLDSGPDAEEFESRLAEFMNAVLHHVREEETDLLPALARAVDRDRLRALGVSFAARRARELSQSPPR